MFDVYILILSSAFIPASLKNFKLPHMLREISKQLSPKFYDHVITVPLSFLGFNIPLLALPPFRHGNRENNDTDKSENSA